MIKILTIIGARPQFIKAAAISRAIRNHFASSIEEVLVHTGQHYDKALSSVFFDELKIPKEKYNLQIGSGSHAEQTAKMLTEIEKVALVEKPDAILLYGDTNSTLAACLVGIKLHVDIIHVEAGVRSYNKEFPEEVNRIICDHMASVLFVPSDAGMESLGRENFKVNELPQGTINASNAAVFRCGDIMYDNTLYFLDQINARGAATFEKYSIPRENFILATMHRPSNVDQHDTLESILSAFNTIIENHGKSIVLPLHPRTKNILENSESLSQLLQNDKLHIIPPVSFLEMIELEKHADLVVTDSGGVQKEAYFMEKPCLIMLDETPWVELVESNNALLVGSDYQKIIDGADHFLNENSSLEFTALYGDGKTSEFICEQLINIFSNK
ncbi:MAG: UDP-N-acetylglucosamine 2-epimerase (non-hydrolyzing) [Crocinitomicaceae bacterium]|nr:UDP-N-acetylglucosamine 2-epimerase (non-hydrolyzing) [Crocinitomicaceae bacterium]